MKQEELDKLNALLRELTDLKDKASARSGNLHRSEALKKLSQGHADGYAYAIQRLKMIFPDSQEG